MPGLNQGPSPSQADALWLSHSPSLNVPPKQHGHTAFSKNVTSSGSIFHRKGGTILKCNRLMWFYSNFLFPLILLAAVNSSALTEEPILNLIDAGLAINTAYPLIFHPERNVKLILSFDYSSGDPFEVIWVDEWVGITDAFKHFTPAGSTSPHMVWILLLLCLYQGSGYFHTCMLNHSWKMHPFSCLFLFQLLVDGV